MKAVVIISDATDMMHTGADLEKRYREFDLPADVEKFIRAAEGKFATVSFALRDEVDRP